MHEAKSWQEKHVILPHHNMQIEPWLKAINFPYLCSFFTMFKGLFFWGNTEKIDYLWNFDVWSQFLAGQTCDTTTPLYGRWTLTHRHQLTISMFFFHHVQGSLSLRKHSKNTAKHEHFENGCYGPMALYKCVMIPCNGGIKYTKSTIRNQSIT